MPKKSARVPTRNAVQHLHNTFGPLFALDDIAQRFQATQLSHFTNHLMVSALLDKVEQELQRVIRALPAGHMAQATAVKVRPLRDALRTFIANVEDGRDGFSIPRATIGAGMLAMVRAIGAEIERAEIACGQRRGFAGYLQGTAEDPARM